MNEEVVIKNKQGCLCFWGNWVGRPYDNVYFLKKYSFHEDLLEMVFTGGETLLIKYPERIESNDNCTVINDSSEIRFIYHQYDIDKGQKIEITYVLQDGVLKKNNAVINKIKDSPALFFG